MKTIQKSGWKVFWVIKILFVVGVCFGFFGCASISPHLVDSCDDLARIVGDLEIDRTKGIDLYINYKRKFTDKWMSGVTIPNGIYKQMQKPGFCASLKNTCGTCEGAKLQQDFMEKFMAAVMRKRIKIASAIDEEEAEMRSRVRIQFMQYRTILNALRSTLKSYLKAKALRQELTKKMGVDTMEFERKIEEGTKKMEKFYEVED